ncbi:hypothetical protein [Modestobacter sp. NPDC049651]|uniref:hypothetical protein n=1 Tax=unclassified Modestobacter TaxID=2643866 RepID=UPI0033DF9DE3
MTEHQDPRTRFRQLPEHARREELVETSDVEERQVVEREFDRELRRALFDPGVP